MSASGMAGMWISAASGLVGAAIGGAISYLALWKQLRHASSEARLTREHTLKREVYFEAAEGVARSVQSIASIARIDLTVQQLSEIQTVNPGWIYKVHAVGDLDTIRTLDEAAESLFSHTLDLMAMRLKLDALRSEATAIYERTMELGAHGRELVAALQAVSAPDAAPEARMLAPQLTQNLLATHEEMTRLRSEHDQAHRRQHHAHRDFVVASMRAVADHQLLLSQANVHIRRELGLPFNAQDYLAHMERSSERILARMKEALDKLEKE